MCDTERRKKSVPSSRSLDIAIPFESVSTLRSLSSRSLDIALSRYGGYPLSSTNTESWLHHAGEINRPMSAQARGGAFRYIAWSSQLLSQNLLLPEPSIKASNYFLLLRTPLREQHSQPVPFCNLARGCWLRRVAHAKDWSNIYTKYAVAYSRFTIIWMALICLDIFSPRRSSGCAWSTVSTRLSLAHILLLLWLVITQQDCMRSP